MSQHYSTVSPEISRYSRIWLLVVASLITLAACSPAAYVPAPFTVEPAVNPPAEKASSASEADQLALQDLPATAEAAPGTGPEPEQVPEPPETIPAIDAVDDPEELMQSALDLALQGDSQGVYQLGLSGDLAYIPVLIDMLRLSRGFPAEETQWTLHVALGDIAKQNFTEFDTANVSRWSWWVKWLGQNPDIKPPPGYAASEPGGRRHRTRWVGCF